ncbi:MAG TPA: hypothetical protein VGR07_03885 [Thermoanaerobaculia bacterium]|nr:hypothetical protein [Thermoanaerobaculia bacterium]
MPTLPTSPMPPMAPANVAPLSRTARGTAIALATLGAAAALAGLVFAGGDGAGQRTWATLLVDDFFFLSLALAGILFLALNYLSSAGWWTVIRRVPEAMMGFLPVAGLLTLPLYFGRHALYPWTRPEILRHDPVVAAKSAYLNTPFFFGRMLLFLALWSLFAYLLRRTSLAQDRAASGEHRRMVRISAFFIVTFAVSFSLASFDWLMSLDPRWFSTIFAIYTFAGLLLSGLAGITLVVVVLRERGQLAGLVGESHLHDLGKLLFAFSTFWAYIWVSQYLLIWYSNIPEEVTFYVTRTSGGWTPLFFLTPVLNWLIPFCFLLPRAAKRNPRVLQWVAVTILLGHWLDLYLLVAPPVLSRVRVGLPELLITAGYASLFFLLTSRALSRAPLLARNDPYLGESLHHHHS